MVNTGYNLFDPLLTYLLYGFVDLQAPILYCGIIELQTLTGMQIKVLGGSGKASQQTVTGVQHLEMFMPSSINRKDNIITINHLIIPNSESRDPLPQVISQILKLNDLEGHYQNSALLAKDTAHIEQQVIDKNLNYWQCLQKEFQETILPNTEIIPTTKNDLKNLCNFSINHLNSYISARQLIRL